MEGVDPGGLDIPEKVFEVDPPGPPDQDHIPLQSHVPLLADPLAFGQVVKLVHVTQSHPGNQEYFISI